MQQDAGLRDKLVTYIEDMYALENQIVEVLEKQVNSTSNFPEVQAMVRQHLEETKMHRSRMEQRLAAYNKKPSSMKGALSNVMGNVMGAMSGTRSDALAMTARDDYVTEHMEIASYGLLIATAQTFGDTETIQAAELNLRDEIRMAHWLEQHLAQAAMLSLQQDGISLPEGAMQSAQQIVQSAMSSASTGLEGSSTFETTYTTGPM